MAASSSRAFRLTRNLTFIGAPGSGKGFYGTPLATAWNVPLLSTSSILRQGLTGADLDSGKLVDCNTVSDTLQTYLSERFPSEAEGGSNSFILDGFPRTEKQIELMNKKWPAHLRVHAAFHLNVPDFVCEIKMLGRRHCVMCDRGFNLGAVHEQGFDLPPQLPVPACDRPRCNPETNWTRRADDTPDIVQERLRIHHENEKPILDHYKSQGRLIALTPFNGDKDLPWLQSSLEAWLAKLE